MTVVTEITEVNLFTFVYRLLYEVFSPIHVTILLNLLQARTRNIKATHSEPSLS